jgi:hypothetical protein
MTYRSASRAFSQPISVCATLASILLDKPGRLDQPELFAINRVPREHLN